MADLIEPKSFDTGVLFGRALLPEGPAMWSYSSLKEIETCPRRYALSRADYPELWGQNGYPRVPVPAAIKGDVVHGALEAIVRALVRAGCSSTRSADAVAVLRELGGYTEVAKRVLAAQLARLDGNPRLSSERREQLTRALNDWLPEAREQIQTYLTRMELHPGADAPVKAATTPGGSATRHAARRGDHPERELVATDLRLKGRVDLLSVDANGAWITDFKTGAEDPTHHDQLRLYALLWVTDTIANPDGLDVSALVAAYPTHEVEVPVPNASELSGLEREIIARIEAAEAVATSDVPTAVVGEHCGVCNVRGLCDRYWTTSAPNTAEVADGDWYDLQGTVVREHGVKSWVLRETKSGHEVLVRTPTPSFALPIGLEVRVLGARRTVDPDDEDSLIAVLTGFSEVLRLAG
ncbi:PD-(D/E)XK nuclease family protein [Pedococcus bigeumensis]|nr:PD-(D/E)XK nuclease family protein [Pedococcus bigeumensis]